MKSFLLIYQAGWSLWGGTDDFGAAFCYHTAGATRLFGTRWLSGAEAPDIWESFLLIYQAGWSLWGGTDDWGGRRFATILPALRACSEPGG